MKKFIKFLIIALLVVAAVTFTCFLFFKNLNKFRQAEVSLVEFSQREEKLGFNSKLESTIAIVNSDSTDTRFSVIQTTLVQLDEAMNSLSAYYIEDNGIVKSNEIAAKVNSINSSISLATAMMEEINIKAYLRNELGAVVGYNPYYNRHLGANDLYICVVNYVKEYAELVKLVNGSIEGVNKNVDIKFAVVELYADVVISTFEVVEEKESGIKEISNYNNINFINNVIRWKNMQIEVKESRFGDSAINFIKYYNLSNKTELAKSFYTTYLNIEEVVNPTNEQTTVIYFKEVFGL